MAFSRLIGFFGAGKMASALAKGFLRARLASPGDLIAADPLENARQEFAQATGAAVTARNEEVAETAGVLIVAVKPDQVSAVFDQIRPRLTAEHLVISIAAGMPLMLLQKYAGPGIRLIRVMPNTPALVGASASAFAAGAHARPEDSDRAKQLFSAVGLALRVKESWLDAVTGLSGSGPAYVYLVIEALSDGGVAAGLPREAATLLAAQTALGAAQMVLQTGRHPGALKDMVASPGGTTIEGLCELENGAVRSSFIKAVRAAAEKSRRLGQSST